MMTVNRCQMCGKLSSDELEVCPFCQARLTPLEMPSSDDSVDDFDLGDQPDDLFSADRIGNTDIDLKGETPLTDDQIGSIEAIQPSANEATDESDSPQNPSELEVKEWLASLDDEGVIDNDPSNLPLGEPSETGKSSDDTDDWITQFRQDDQGIDQLDEKKFDDKAAEDTSTSDDDLSGWLQNFKNNDGSDDQPYSSDETDQNIDDLNTSLNWSDRLDSNTESLPVSGEPDNSTQLVDGSAPEDENEQEMSLESKSDGILDDTESPDWLKNLQEETRTFIDDTRQEELPSPDWMADLQAETGDSLEDGDSDEREVPAWLREIGSDPLSFDEINTSSSDFQEPIDTEIGGDQVSVQELADRYVQGSNIESLDQVSDDKDALEGIKIPELETGDEGIPESLPPDPQSIQEKEPDDGKTSDDSVPDWLQDIESLPAPSDAFQEAELGDQSIEDISGELQSADLPDWLNELRTDLASSSEELMDADEAKKLSVSQQEDLPEWVQDLQPVETMLDQDEINTPDLDEYIESSGPLAGLRGVLPAVAGMTAQHQSKIKRDPTQLSPDQNHQVEMINELIESESKPIEAPKLIKKNTQKILRWSVAILMIIAVVLPRIMGFPHFSSSSNYPPDLLNSRQAIFDMAYSSPVLLIFDYEPAYSAELEATASAVVTDLINKDSRLTIVSTSPTGMVLSNHFLGVVKDQATSQGEIQVTELGYLPGGSRGIARFASNPSATLPYSTDGDLVWETQDLKDVHSIEDFSLVLLLTENPDTARDWIEQAGGYLVSTPFLLAVSAQAEPLVRPYYESGQVDGLVTGLAGGKIYEQTLNISGMGESYWNSFSSGLFMFEIIILIGVLWGLITLLQKRKPGQKEEV